MLFYAHGCVLSMEHLGAPLNLESAYSMLLRVKKNRKN